MRRLFSNKADLRVLNRAIWYSATGFTRPYPGDETVLSAIEVTGDDDD